MKNFFTPTKLRYIFFWLKTASLIGGPVWVLADNYNLFYFKEYTKFKWGLMGLIVTVIVTVYFIKTIKEWIQGWKPSLGKSFIDIFIHFLPYGIAWIVIDLFKNRVTEIQSQFTTICWFLLLGFAFKQGHDYYKDKCQKIALKKELETL